MELSIIIVNWHSKEYVRKCLASIYKNTIDLTFEVIIIDNASHDGCKGLLEDEYHDVLFIQAQENLGFAQANNLAFQCVRGNIILFLNPDTEIIGSAIKTMYSSLQRMPDAGAVGCKLLNTDLSTQIDSIQPFPTILTQIFSTQLLMQLFPRFKWWGIRPLYADEGNPVTVDVVSGACIMVTRSVFEAIDMFSDDYFMYSEEVDLCYKILKNGLKIYYISEAKIIHHGGGCTKKYEHLSKWQIVLMKESRARFFVKTKGKWYATAYRFTLCLVAVFRLIIAVLLYPMKGKLNNTFDLASTSMKWLTILRWTLGLENETASFYE